MQSFTPGLFDRLDADDDATFGRDLTPSRKSDGWIVITAQRKNPSVADPMQFNAMFQPSLQRYSIQSVRGTP